MNGHPDTDEMRRKHRKMEPVRHDEEAGRLVPDGPAICIHCPTQGWPCDVVSLCDEVDALRSALYWYGGHHSTCPTRRPHLYGKNVTPTPCNCGWPDVQKDGP